MRLDVEKTILVVIDLQERLVPVMDPGDAFLSAAMKLVAGSLALNVAVLATEQYPKGLGPTVAKVAEALGSKTPIFEKRAFSAWDDTNFRIEMEKLRNDGRDSVILCGIETHVCVLQTANDLVHAGWNVFVTYDATASRDPYDKELAARRLATEGVRPATVESVLFELCRTSLNPHFKTISNLVK